MYINKAKIIVIKIGSSNLVDKKGKLREKWLKSFVSDIKKIKKKRNEFCYCFVRCNSFRSGLS